MSRIGKLPVQIPAGVQVTVDDKNHTVVVKGKLGELRQKVNPDIKVEVENNQLKVSRPSDDKIHRSLHGLYRALIANMVKGVSEGFTIKQEMVGVGYRATSQGQLLDISVGYSHNILMELPKEVQVNVVTEKRSNPIITLQVVINNFWVRLRQKFVRSALPNLTKAKVLSLWTKFCAERQVRRLLLPSNRA